MSKKVALLIGVSEYGEGIPSLSGPLNDVAAIKRVLSNPNRGGFDEVETLINPKVAAMQTSVQKIFKDCRQDDLVLLYFSGHGITDDNNRLYLATKGTSKDYYEATSVSARFIQYVSLKSCTKRQAIILDCCYSGAFAEGWQAKSIGLDLKKELGAEGRVVLTSSTATQTSFQQVREELSLYTKYLIEGIETGAADNDKDGKIHADELHDYAKAKVQEENPKQKPGIIIAREGFKIILSQAPKETEYQHAKQVKQQQQEQEDYENKLQEYKQEFALVIERGYSLDGRVRDTLKDFQNWLGLTDEDIARIEQPILAQEEEAKRRRKQETERAKQLELQKKRRRLLAGFIVILMIVVVYFLINRPETTYQDGLLETEELEEARQLDDYSQLREDLEAKNWQMADLQTVRVIIQAAGREKEGFLRRKDLYNLSCEDLSDMERLWLKSSGDKFGFSVQKDIYQNLGGMGEYNSEIWLNFTREVGWRQGDKWLDSYAYNTFSEPPKGLLPYSVFLGEKGWGAEYWGVVLNRPKEDVAPPNGELFASWWFKIKDCSLD